MEPDALTAALAGSRLADFNVLRKIGGKDVAPGAMTATLTMHGVCAYVYTVTSRRPRAGAAGELALKVMINLLGDQTGDLHEQFAAEYELLADARRLPRHPNIIPVLHRFDDLATAEHLPGYDFDPQDVSPRTTFVVMPLCDRGDVRAAMKRTFRGGELFSEAWVRHILSQLLDAVRHLKAHRIVHRDIKSDNIMLQSSAGGEGTERVVLIDFGQCLDCAQWEFEGFKMPLLLPMSRGGAPGFLAPEVVKPHPGPSTVIDYAMNDDWAVGMLLYGMLAGPVHGPDPFSSGDDPRRFEDADYRPLDLHAGGYGAGVGEVARGLLRVNPNERLDVGAALTRMNDPAELLAQERVQRQRAEGELEVVRQQLLQAQATVLSKDREIAQLREREAASERQRQALETENLRLHQSDVAAEEENQGLRDELQQQRQRVAQMQARIRELEQVQQVRST